VAGAQGGLDAGQSWAGGLRPAARRKVLQGITGPVLVFPGPDQEEVDVEARGKAGVEFRQGRQGLKGRGVQGRGLGQVENDVGVRCDPGNGWRGSARYTVGELSAGWVVFYHQNLQPRRDRAARHRRISSLRLGRERLGRLFRAFGGRAAMR